MTGRVTFATAAVLLLLSGPALAEPRWLGCKYTDTSGKQQNFVMVFDDIRLTAALLDGRELVDGSGTSVNFQSLRTRFPQYNVTYNRNDGSLSISPTGGMGGILTGECRRIAPPPGAPPMK